MQEFQLFLIPHHETNIKVQTQELEECNYNCSIFGQLKHLHCFLTMRLKSTTIENKGFEVQQRQS